MADDADRHVALALKHLAARNMVDAETEARAALALRPDHPDALHLLGIVAWHAGHPEEAAPLIARTVELAPNFADAHWNLGLVRRELGRTVDAIKALRRSGELQPDNPDSHYRLATLLRGIGDPDGAILHYRRVLALAPDHADALNDLGATMKDYGYFEEALDLFRQVAAASPDHATAFVNLGNSLMDLGRPALARTEYRRALEIAPARGDARFGHCLSQIPIVYGSDREIPTCRAAYGEELRRLQAHYREAKPEELAAAADGIGHLPFYLAYQGENDRQLQESFGGLLARLMAARYPQWAARPAQHGPGPDGLIRVGMVSGFFRDHSVWKLFGGWVREMDRRRFRLYGYSTSRRPDAETKGARASFDSFVESSPSIGALAQRISEDALHVLIYPEIGMDPTTARLAALRLAPLQCAAWGHPSTTGLPTIDYFLSSELMEPEGGAAFYSEKLVQLPNLSIHYQPLDVTPVTPDLAALGIRPGAVKYLCCQSLYKYLPRNDDIFPRIAADVPEAQFLFLQHGWAPEITELTKKRISAAFQLSGMDPAQHLVFLPTQDPAHYAGLNAAADVYLDSLEWSGGNTTLEAIAAGVPIVTLPGKLMRGRHSAGILNFLRIGDTIARDKDEYVTMAARLGRDLWWRRAMADRIVARRSRLYGDETPVRALEMFIEKQVAAAVPPE